ncbi:hypothetical protein [Streptomyces sp. NPDC051704]|uniref:hypothetical protein n=1 Tax=Streptomyces sp. NPDC051704 TaxID=3365671 RepID=UPI0037AC15B7
MESLIARARGFHDDPARRHADLGPLARGEHRPQAHLALHAPDIVVRGHIHCGAVDPLPGNRALRRKPPADRPLCLHASFHDITTGRVAVRDARTGVFGPL